MKKLKPCPFCGGEAEFIEQVHSKWCVKCKSCWAKSILVEFFSEQETVNAWNRRAK